MSLVLQLAACSPPALLPHARPAGALVPAGTLLVAVRRAASPVATSPPGPPPGLLLRPAAPPGVGYVQKRVVAPLRLALLLSWSAMVRHTATQRKADLEEELDEGSRITWVGAAVNFVLAFLKLFAGVTGRSAAMIADAGHSFSDLISDGVTLLALRMSTLPADIDHPYGHGRFESVASLAIGALLLGAGASFGAGSLAALAAPTPRPPMLIALWAAVASIGSKERPLRALRGGAVEASLTACAYVNRRHSTARRGAWARGCARRSNPNPNPNPISSLTLMCKSCARRSSWPMPGTTAPTRSRRWWRWRASGGRSSAFPRWTRSLASAWPA